MIEFLSKNYLRTQNEEREEKEKEEKEKESIIPQPSAAENMDVDEHNSNNSNSGAYVCFLRKVLREESGDNHHINIHMLMAIAVHAILIESGFVGYDPISGDRVDHKFQQVFVVDDDHCRPSVSFCYTLSEILENNKNNGHKPQTVVAKLDFESFGQCLTVSAGSSSCGSEEEEGSVVFQVSLYDHKLESILRFPLLAQHRNGLEQFFLSVRDELAFPLKIKLREEAGLPSLPCFMGLHSDLKMKILEFLPGTEVAKLECTCKEMRILSAKKQSNKFWETRIPCCTCDLRHHGKRFIYWKKVYEDYYEEIIGVNMFLEEERQEMMRSREKIIKEPKNKGKSLLKGKRIKIT
ncbi:putative F-box protein At1g23770 [Humulus lupulus]|uniref:putative F-box protein At1g23770 n=1 Tax=Humulus lupulus TaxID=3486 RepID=UPI002B41342C|nr:putative F-box protein At1g23770 [Humulus lupulus]